MIELREFTAADYEQVISIWRQSEGVVLREADERAPVERYAAALPSRRSPPWRRKGSRSAT